MKTLKKNELNFVSGGASNASAPAASAPADNSPSIADRATAAYYGFMKASYGCGASNFGTNSTSSDTSNRGCRA